MTVIAYIRVSTKGQGESGLGLEAQRSAVALFVTQRGAIILVECREVENGKKKDRPELAKALAHCRRAKAKLDRLVVIDRESCYTLDCTGNLPMSARTCAR